MHSQSQVLEMEGQTENHMTSAAAFVEGGIQESSDNACSICLEEFCASDPSTVTNCKHEFHLHCILEWCQRSSQCPMCWQCISLKDPTSQELFETIEQERKFRLTRSRNASIYHHPAFSDFELQHLRMSVNDADFDERIIQHLAVTAAMRRANQLGLREGQRTRSSTHAPPQLLVFSNQANAPSSGPDSVVGGENDRTTIPNRSSSTPITSDGNEASPQILHLQIQRSSSTSGSRGSSTRSSPTNEDSVESSEFQSLSDSLRSRLNAVSMRYKESISKGARGWKERLFCHSSSMSELGSETRRREMNAGIASASRLRESLETSDNNRAVCTSLSNNMEDCSTGGVSNQNNVEASGENSSHDDNTAAACPVTSHLN